MLRPLFLVALDLFLILKFAQGASWPSETLRSYRDEAYALDVKIGTPPQTFSLTVMIETYRIVVPAPSCQECCRKKAYDPKQSSTGACTPGTQFGWVSTAGDCNDTVTAFGRTLKNYDFKDVVNTSSVNFFVRDGTWDGIFGLSDMSNFTDEPFGLILQRTCTPEGAIATSAGTITYGGMDTNNCGDVFATLQLIDDPASPSLSGISGLTRLEKVQLSSSSAPAIVDAHGGWKVNFETASPEIRVPRKVFDKLTKNWLATLNARTGEWDVDCSIAGYLDLSFADAPQPLSLPVQQLVYRVEDSCVLRLRPWGPNDEFYESSYWTFGLPLFRTYCSLYDFKKHQLSFASPKTPATSYCIYSKLKPKAPCVLRTTTATSPSTSTPSTRRITKEAPTAPPRTTTTLPAEGVTRAAASLPASLATVATVLSLAYLFAA